jgi:hypothetical protein
LFQDFASLSCLSRFINHRCYTYLIAVITTSLFGPDSYRDHQQHFTTPLFGVITNNSSDRSNISITVPTPIFDLQQG